MRIEHYSVEKLKREVRSIVAKYLATDAYKIFFFGSRARDDNFSGADIDLGIEGPEDLEPELKFKIEEELDELPTLYKFDFVDFRKVSDGFRKEAMEHVEYV